MNKIIIHVDMDAFFAAVEVRDNPELEGKPLIIGALPHERGVVSTCSYEARKFGLHSAMSIKEAYRLCPQGVYMHPNMGKYKDVSDSIHEIWCTYTNIIEYLSLDEGYLDVSSNTQSISEVESIGRAIKRRTKQEIGLTCSVGIGYSMMSAKLASEEKKPDGFFEITSPEALRNLIIDRNVRTIYGIGSKTAEKLKLAGIYTVRDIYNNEQKVMHLLGNHGAQIIELANGIDNRQVTPYYESESKSIGREHTLQRDESDFNLLKDALRLIARELSMKIRLEGLYSRTITLKVKYGNMKSITRSKSADATNDATVIYKTAASMLDGVERHPVRLIGISLSNFTQTGFQQLTLDNMSKLEDEEQKEKLDDTLLNIQRKYGRHSIKTASELNAEMHWKDKTDIDEKVQGGKKHNK